MHRNPFLDLAYTHETVAAPAQAPIAMGDTARVARDLSARLRCLKTLIDAERDEQANARHASADTHVRGLH